MTKLRSDELGMFAGSEQQLITMSTAKGSNRAQVIATGALHLLKLNWTHGEERAQLRSALIAACLLSFGLGLLLLLPAAMALAAHNQRQICHPLARTSLGRDSGESTNVYFLKHENRSWTTEELCHIETAARRYPEFNILMINLRSDVNQDLQRSWNFEFSNLVEHSDLRSGEEAEFSKRNDTEFLSNKLMDIPNVVNFDVELHRFFSGSALARKIGHLDSRDIEIAARFQAIWDSPGISLDPLAIHQMNDIGDSNGSRRGRKAMATIQIESDFQATTVPCHSFVGQIISEIARNTFTDRKSALKHALRDFCPSRSNCYGVKILEPSLTELDVRSCPIVDSASAQFETDATSTNSLVPVQILRTEDARGDARENFLI